MEHRVVPTNATRIILLLAISVKQDDLALMTACKEGKTEDVISLMHSGVDLDFSNIVSVKEILIS